MNQKANQREATKQAFLTALEAELVSGKPLTVEAIAGRAGANKALIYRYFGGLSGLITAYAADETFMPSAAELLLLCDDDLRALPPRVRFSQCVQACVVALAKRPATVQILLRLSTFDPETLAALRSGRLRGIADIRRAFGDSDSGLGFDSDLAFNLLVAGICQILGARRLNWLQEETDDSELVASLSRTIAGLLVPPSAGDHEAND
ncbi:transcriptional regulator, TetR family [Singulisphaera sp. GP187]|uniref:TetR/AcrR family transcriptional regulator n=1 Tax=Singulisphaera sp. GP187 TaxID=1882752 RepID=UPI0009295ABE|nr:TetR/AcrR family transcriptional regulator [Singulisphaera sp. GP187]SIO59176.1 transcriptional regulator, TetR family [Singulisphaera sp. GP187]